MTRWAERIFVFLAGVAAGIVVLWWAGRVTFGGDFLANVAGATIGGGISVLLAVGLAHRERALASRDADEHARRQHAEALRHQLRYIRAIRECSTSLLGVTQGNREPLLDSAGEAASLAKAVLDDPSLTDFPLRRAQEKASEIGWDLYENVLRELAVTGELNPNRVIPGIDTYVNPVLAELDQIINDYERLRATPPTY